MSSSKGLAGSTYSVGKPDDLIAQFPFFAILALVPAVLVHLDDFAGEFDAHDRFASLGGQGVLALTLHNVHPVEAESFDLRGVQVAASRWQSVRSP